MRFQSTALSELQSLSAKGMKFRAGVKMKWGNVCQEPQVRLTQLTPRIGASSPADSIPQPCILASVPLPGVHLPDTTPKQQPRWPPSVFHFDAVSVSHRRLYFKARLGYRKDRSVFPHLGRTWRGGAIQGPSPPVPVRAGRLARMGPQRLCQPLPSLPSSPCPPPHPLQLFISGHTRCGPDLHPPETPFPLQAPSPDPPPPVHEASAEPTEVPNLPPALASSSQHGTPAPGAFQSLLQERRQEGTVPSGAGGGAMKKVSPSQASSAPLTRQKTLACCWRVSLASGTTDVQRAH